MLFGENAISLETEIDCVQHEKHCKLWTMNMFCLLKMGTFLLLCAPPERSGGILLCKCRSVDLTLSG